MPKIPSSPPAQGGSHPKRGAMPLSPEQAGTLGMVAGGIGFLVFWTWTPASVLLVPAFALGVFAARRFRRGWLPDQPDPLVIGSVLLVVILVCAISLPLLRRGEADLVGHLCSITSALVLLGSAGIRRRQPEYFGLVLGAGIAMVLVLLLAFAFRPSGVQSDGVAAYFHVNWRGWLGLFVGAFAIWLGRSGVLKVRCGHEQHRRDAKLAITLLKKDAERVRSLLASGANPNGERIHVPMLFLAIYRKHVPSIDALLDAGADPSATAPDSVGRVTAADYAARQGLSEVAERLKA